MLYIKLKSKNIKVSDSIVNLGKNVKQFSDHKGLGNLVRRDKKDENGNTIGRKFSLLRTAGSTLATAVTTAGVAGKLLLSPINIDIPNVFANSNNGNSEKTEQVQIQANTKPVRACRQILNQFLAKNR